MFLKIIFISCWYAEKYFCLNPTRFSFNSLVFCSRISYHCRIRTFDQNVDNASNKNRIIFWFLWGFDAVYSLMADILITDVHKQEKNLAIKEVWKGLVVMVKWSVWSPSVLKIWVRIPPKPGAIFLYFLFVANNKDRQIEAVVGQIKRSLKGYFWSKKGSRERCF